jgi:hypothetical protein
LPLLKQRKKTLRTVFSRAALFVHTFQALKDN